MTELYIADNRIRKVSRVVTLFPNLEILDISNNAVDSLDELLTLSGLENLAELFVAGNPIVSEPK